jgi:hypothetical protein
MLQWAGPIWVKDQFPHKASSPKVENRKSIIQRRNEFL